MLLTVLFYILFVCKCVLYYCHRVSTQLQLTNISFHISYRIVSCRVVSYIIYLIIYHMSCHMSYVTYHISHRIVYRVWYITLILRRSRTGTVWFYTSTSNKRAARPKLYTKSLTRDLKLMYIRFTLVRISIKLYVPCVLYIGTGVSLLSRERFLYI